MNSTSKNQHISFFMPAYNCEATVRESVESIMEGNFEDGDELVIVNDCSKDNTQLVLDELSKKYPAIKILNHPRNKGGGAARNTAIENTKNDVLFCLDSDNILFPGSIKRLMTFMLDNQADVATFGEVRYFVDHQENVTHSWKYNKKTVLADCLSKFAVPGASGNYMFTKESWIKAGGYPEYTGALDTWGFGFRQLATGSTMKSMPDSYYLHRYGYESYWVRDSKIKGKISLSALQMLIPFFYLIKERDINYMMGRWGRYKWFENLEKRPIRLK